MEYFSLGKFSWLIDCLTWKFILVCFVSALTTFCDVCFCGCVNCSEPQFCDPVFLTNIWKRVWEIFYDSWSVARSSIQPQDLSIDWLIDWFIGRLILQWTIGFNRLVWSNPKFRAHFFLKRSVRKMDWSILEIFRLSPLNFSDACCMQLCSRFRVVDWLVDWRLTATPSLKTHPQSHSVTPTMAPLIRSFVSIKEIVQTPKEKNSPFKAHPSGKRNVHFREMSFLSRPLPPNSMTPH